MLTINVRTDNAAFQGPEGDDWAMQMEAARILRDIANRIERGEATGKFQTVFDINGNDVGRWKLSQGD